MKALVCELCGCNDIMKQNGYFVCQHCGTKYTPEEARKLLIDGPVEVYGTVKVDASEQKQEKIDNYLELARSALDGHDISGVISYCDKVLESDINNYEAWILKAKASGWGSSLKDMKITQALTAAKRAVNLAPDTKKYDVAEEVYISIKAQVMALLRAAQRMPGLSGIPYAHTIMLLWKSVLTDIPFLSKALIEQEIDDCKKACEVSKRGMLPFERQIYAAYFAHNDGERYDVTFRSALENKIKLEEHREKEFKAKAKVASDAKIAAYWAEHIELKSSLLERKASAKARQDELELEMNHIPELSMASELHERIEKLTKQKNALGVFKGKERKSVQEQINIVTSELDSIEKAISQKKYAIQEMIDEQSSIIDDIDHELSKER